MRVVKELNSAEREWLSRQHSQNKFFATHIEVVINKAHCFELEIMPEGYNRIVVFAGGRLNFLSQEVGMAEDNPNLVHQYFYGLYGEVLQKYLDVFRQCNHTLPACFRQLGGCFLLDKSDEIGRSAYEVTDGQHRLLAYGLVTGMDESKFPITVYWGTDKARIV